MSIYKYKVILLGNVDVGKTSLFRKLRGDKDISSKEDSIDLRPFTLEFKLKEGTIQLEVNDTNGMERFRNSIPTNFYRNTHAVVLMYDITECHSLHSLEEWVEEVESRLHLQRVTYAMIGNRLDRVDDESDLAEGGIYRERFDIPLELHFLMSVENETTHTLRKMFEELAWAVHETQRGRERSNSATRIVLPQTGSERRSSCCPVSSVRS